MRLVLALTLLLSGAEAQARVFNFNDGGLAVFLRGKGGTSSVGKDTFGDSSGADTVIEDEVKYSYGGELGVLLGVGSGFNLRLGAEIIRHHPVTDGNGKNPAGQDRFTYDAYTFLFNPNIAAEIFLEQGQSTRYFAQVGVGYAMVDVENRYRMTAQGTSDTGLSDFNEKMSGTTMSYMLGVGLETLMLDNVTFSLEAGYQHIQLKELKYTGDLNNFVSPGGAAKGDPALKHDGSKRELNLSTPFAGASLRFYLNFL